MKKGYRLLVFSLCFLVLFYLFSEIQKTIPIFSFLKSLCFSLLPFITGLFLAYLFEPFTKFLSKRLPRVVASFIPFLLIGLFLFLLGFMFLPTFFKEGSELLGKSDLFLLALKNKFNQLSFFKKTPFLKQKIFLFLDSCPSILSSFFDSYWVPICKSCLKACSFFLFSFLIGFYLLYDFPKIKRTLKKHLPSIYLKETRAFLKSFRKTMGHYILGVLLVMFLVFITQFIGFTLSRLKSPLFFAFLCALTDFIPYIGPYLGGIPCVLVAFSMSSQIGFLTLISIMVVQFLENSFYQPYILGKTLFLPPWLILGTLSVLSSLFGILGLLIAMPLLVFLKIFIPFLITCVKKKNSIASD